MKFIGSLFTTAILAATLGTAVPVVPEIPRNSVELSKRSQAHRRRLFLLIDSEQSGHLYRRTPSPVPIPKQHKYEYSSSDEKSNSESTEPIQIIDVKTVPALLMVQLRKSFTAPF
ncbi:hypothetical protein BJ085DRAFT_38597 [Dimargaris cristalligena]|uniref:Uncharacterized protein n=1 Tax=Dimargaris cristalligena TaxID=215637 RepID=A0A4P9ZJC2_9FUNG|nr:hypothetical protein BJ085DRAFT_38597 [Dimargaris cristalligena]|eukprot:RKP33307.1 hypothetical protein BJ085DRAFT_38597 [Dimargaris cristalligena]